MHRLNKEMLKLLFNINNIISLCYTYYKKKNEYDKFPRKCYTYVYKHDHRMPE